MVMKTCVPSFMYQHFFYSSWDFQFSQIIKVSHQGLVSCTTSDSMVTFGIKVVWELMAYRKRFKISPKQKQLNSLNEKNGTSYFNVTTVRQTFYYLKYFQTISEDWWNPSKNLCILLGVPFCNPRICLKFNCTLVFEVCVVFIHVDSIVANAIPQISPFTPKNSWKYFLVFRTSILDKPKRCFVYQWKNNEI